MGPILNAPIVPKNKFLVISKIKFPRNEKKILIYNFTIDFKEQIEKVSFSDTLTNV